MDQSLQVLLQAEKSCIKATDFENLGLLCASLPDKVLTDGLLLLNFAESKSVVVILAVLGELNDRKTLVAAGYPSLFQYCLTKLRYSEDQACVRIRAARAAKKYPRILRLLGQQFISVTAVSRLWPHLTSENYRSLLGKACRRSLDDVERLIASISPRDEPRTVIRALSVGRNEPLSPKKSIPQLELTAAPEVVKADAEADAAIDPELSNPAYGQPRLKGRVLFSFTASEVFRAKFNRAREVMRHVTVEGSPEVIFDKGLELLLEQRDPMRQIARKDRKARLKEGNEKRKNGEKKKRG